MSIEIFVHKAELEQTTIAQYKIDGDAKFFFKITKTWDQETDETWDIMYLTWRQANTTRSISLAKVENIDAEEKRIMFEEYQKEFWEKLKVSPRIFFDFKIYKKVAS